MKTDVSTVLQLSTSNEIENQLIAAKYLSKLADDRNKLIKVIKNNKIGDTLMALGSSDDSHVLSHTIQAILAISQLEAQDKIHIIEKLAEKGIFKVLSSITRCYDHTIQIKAIQSVGNFGSREESAAHLVEDGALLSIIGLLRSHQNSLAAYAAANLAKINLKSELSCRMIVVWSLSPMKCLLEHCREQSIVHFVLLALSRYSRTKQISSEVLKTNLLSTIIYHLEHPFSLKIQKLAAKTIYNLSTHVSLRSTMAENEDISRMLMIHNPDIDVKSLIARSLNSIIEYKLPRQMVSNNTDIHVLEWVMQIQEISKLQSLVLKAFADNFKLPLPRQPSKSLMYSIQYATRNPDPELQLLATKCIYLFTSTENTRSLVVDSGGVRNVVKLLGQRISELKQYALSILALLSENEHLHPEMIKYSVISSVISIISVENKNENTVHTIMIIIKNLSISHAYFLKELILRKNLIPILLSIIERNSDGVKLLALSTLVSYLRIESQTLGMGTFLSTLTKHNAFPKLAVLIENTENKQRVREEAGNILLFFSNSMSGSPQYAKLLIYLVDFLPEPVAQSTLQLLSHLLCKDRYNKFTEFAMKGLRDKFYRSSKRMSHKSMKLLLDCLVQVSQGRNAEKLFKLFHNVNMGQFDCGQSSQELYKNLNKYYERIKQEMNERNRKISSAEKEEHSTSVLSLSEMPEYSSKDSTLPFPLRRARSAIPRTKRYERKRSSERNSRFKIMKVDFHRWDESKERQREPYETPSWVKSLEKDLDLEMEFEGVGRLKLGSRKGKEQQYQQPEHIPYYV